MPKLKTGEWKMTVTSILGPKTQHVLSIVAVPSNTAQPYKAFLDGDECGITWNADEATIKLTHKLTKSKYPWDLFQGDYSVTTEPYLAFFATVKTHTLSGDARRILYAARKLPDQIYAMWTATLKETVIKQPPKPTVRRKPQR
jgi:hypothetical protein